MPWYVFGVFVLVLAGLGLVTDGVYFLGRDNVVRVISKDSTVTLYWVVEALYIFCGTLIILYGSQRRREERELKGIREPTIRIEEDS